MKLNEITKDQKIIYVRLMMVSETAEHRTGSMGML